MPGMPWTCSCGRRVPAAVAACRCGNPRPAEAPTLAAGADALSKLRPEQPAQDWSWAPKLLSVVVVVALYFGSRSFNRYSTSKEARQAAVQGLGQVLDPTQARDMVDRHHAGCFDAYYQTGWGRRQSAAFATDKYAKCVLDKVMADLDRESSALQRAARAASPPRRAAATTQPTPLAPPVTRPSWGQVTLGDLKVREFQREPQLSFRVEFVALGANLTPSAMCAFAVTCEGQSPGASLVVGCPLQIEGAKATGQLHYATAGPAPKTGACTLELQLSDGGTTRSNKATAALR